MTVPPDTITLEDWLVAAGVVVLVLFVIPLATLVVRKVFFRDRLDRTTCPKCRTKVAQSPRSDRRWKSGADCPACGKWFPVRTWDAARRPPDFGV